MLLSLIVSGYLPIPPGAEASCSDIFWLSASFVVRFASYCFKEFISLLSSSWSCLFLMSFLSLSNSSAYLCKVSFYSLSSCFFKATMSFFRSSNFLFTSSLSSLACLARVSLSISSRFFCASSLRRTLSGLSSMSLLKARSFASAYSARAFNSSVCP